MTMGNADPITTPTLNGRAEAEHHGSALDCEPSSMTAFAGRSDVGYGIEQETVGELGGIDYLNGMGSLGYTDAGSDPLTGMIPENLWQGLVDGNMFEDLDNGMFTGF
jgi:hypothetical protein